MQDLIISLLEGGELILMRDFLSAGESEDICI